MERPRREPTRTSCETGREEVESEQEEKRKRTETSGKGKETHLPVMPVVHWKRGGSNRRLARGKGTNERDASARKGLTRPRDRHHDSSEERQEGEPCSSLVPSSGEEMKFPREVEGEETETGEGKGS